ncbi:thioredoxin-dependent thiol peroxidase [Candidatus Woesearchaeota archaeon]|nr:thioredoxin-dependent thiol peroxidase [Candidatus Woesearchaeota archaeon]
MMKEGEKSIDFSLPNQDGKDVSLKDFKGKWLVLYFYPKDDTPGCTIEAIDFTRLIGEFEKKNAAVIGISPDDARSHCNFQEKHRLKITLLSDPSHKTLEKFGVWKEKSMYGRKYMGVERTTVLIDPKGVIKKVWNKVSVTDHAKDVLGSVSVQ